MNRTQLKLIVGLWISFLAIASPRMIHAAAAPKSLEGHWEAQVTGDGKTFSFIFEFKTNGNVLTGTVGISTQDRTFDIKNGKIDGDHVSFLAFGDWTGTLKGDSLKLTRGLDYGKKQYMTAHKTSGD